MNKERAMLCALKTFPNFKQQQPKLARKSFSQSTHVPSSFAINKLNAALQLPGSPLSPLTD